MRGNLPYSAAMAFAGPFAFPAIAAAQPYNDGYGPHMWGGPGWFMGPVMMILFLVVAVVVVVAVVRWLGGTSHGMHKGHFGRESALDILRERYARGEIDGNEYDERRRKLSE